MKCNQNRPKPTLLRSRSSQACLCESWHTLLSDLGAVVCSLWLPAAIMGLNAALLFIVLRYSNESMMLIEMIVALVMFAALLVWTGETVGQLLTVYLDPDSRPVERIKLKGIVALLSSERLPAFYTLLFVLFMEGVFLYGSYILLSVSLWFVPVVIVLLSIATVWLWTVYYRVRCMRETCLHALVSGVKLAFRYFTSSWMMLLSTTFLTLISTAVVFMPLFVLNMAIHASNEAAMYGDAVNLPSSVFVYHFVLSWLLVSIIAICLACFWMIPHTYHAYSLEAKEQQRMQALLPA